MRQSVMIRPAGDASNPRLEEFEFAIAEFADQLLQQKNRKNLFFQHSAREQLVCYLYQEVEAHLRIACASDTVACVAWPVQHGTADGLIGFVAGSAVPLAEVRDMLKARLPQYMVPTRICRVESIPLSANGKIDRKALLHLLEQGAL